MNEPFLWTESVIYNRTAGFSKRGFEDNLKKGSAYPSPCLYLVVGVNVGDMRQTTGMGVDSGSLGEE